MRLRLKTLHKDRWRLRSTHSRFHNILIVWTFSNWQWWIDRISLHFKRRCDFWIHTFFFSWATIKNSMGCRLPSVQYDLLTAALLVLDYTKQRHHQRVLSCYRILPLSLSTAGYSPAHSLQLVALAPVQHLVLHRLDDVIVPLLVILQTERGFCFISSIANIQFQW